MSDWKVKAEQILKAYAEDHEGLNANECSTAGLSKDQCGVLVKALGSGVKGEITVEERTALEQAGFAKKFIQEIAGTDGAKALQRRAQFFAGEVEEQIKKLKDANWDVRYSAVWALGEILEKNDPMTLIPYLPALDPMAEGRDAACDPDCRQNAGEVLQKLEEKLR